MTLNSETTGSLNGTPITFTRFGSIEMSGLASGDTFNIAQLDAGVKLTVNGGNHDDVVNIANGGSVVRGAIAINGDVGGDVVNLAPNAPAAALAIVGAITFNGGADADTLNIGSGSVDAVAGLVTYNAGAASEGNTLNLDDDTTPLFYNYAVSNTSITHVNPLVFGGVDYSGVAAISLECSQGPNVVRVTASDPASVLINGNGGNDDFVIGDGVLATAFFGDGGEGGSDDITFDDHLNPANLNWFLEPNNVWAGSRIYNTNGFENVTALAGAGTNHVTFDGTLAQSFTVDAGDGADVITFNNSVDFGAPAAVNGGAGGDTFAWNAADNLYVFPGFPEVPHNVQLDGGAGGDIDVLSINDATRGDTNYNIDKDRLRGLDFFSLAPGFDLGYAGFESIDLTASNFQHGIVVRGTPASIPSSHQMTIYGGASQDLVTVVPHDAAGNLTINGNLGFGGGGGTLDSVTIDDSASPTGATWTINNPFGAGTQNFTIAGGAGLGFASDVEQVHLLGSPSDDVYNIESYASGSTLEIDANVGQDVVHITPAGGNVSAGLTSLASFDYDGGEGFDYFRLTNVNNSSPWSYTRTTAYLQATRQGGSAYSQTFNQTSVEYIDMTAGGQADNFLIQSTPEFTYNTFRGGLGDDLYTLGDAMQTSAIVSNVAVVNDAGVDSVVIDDRNSSTGKRLHVDQYFVNGVAGDTLFGPGGYLYHVNIAGTLTVRLGGGADEVLARTSPIESVLEKFVLEGNNPVSAPGDSLLVTMSAVTNPVFTPNGPGAGTYSFGNSAPIVYSGFETASAVLEADFDGSGAVDNADLEQWHAGYGVSDDGDADGDGDTDGADFLAWQRNAGAQLAPPAVDQFVAASAPVVGAELRSQEAIVPRGSLPVLGLADDALTTKSLAARDGAFARELGARHRPVLAAFDAPRVRRPSTGLVERAAFRPPARLRLSAVDELVPTTTAALDESLHELDVAFAAMEHCGLLCQDRLELGFE
jgi:hypothetical protein